MFIHGGWVFWSTEDIRVEESGKEHVRGSEFQTSKLTGGLCGMNRESNIKEAKKGLVSRAQSWNKEIFADNNWIDLSLVGPFFEGSSSVTPTYKV